uniref:Uncharacterized protein isoform X2 n=1 Tax=Pogona vitticeps TaxID=103695 RepID=A0ABM5EQ88_9SAUR
MRLSKQKSFSSCLWSLWRLPCRHITIHPAEVPGDPSTRGLPTATIIPAAAGNAGLQLSEAKHAHGDRGPNPRLGQHELSEAKHAQGEKDPNPQLGQHEVSWEDLGQMGQDLYDHPSGLGNAPPESPGR